MNSLRWLVGIVAAFIVFRPVWAQELPSTLAERQALAATLKADIGGMLTAIPELQPGEVAWLEKERETVSAIADATDRLKRSRALSVTRESLTSQVRQDFELALDHLEELEKTAFPPEEEAVRWLVVERALRFRCLAFNLLVVRLVKDGAVTENTAMHIFDGGQAIGWSFGIHGRCDKIMDRCVVPLVAGMRAQIAKTRK